MTDRVPSKPGQYSAVIDPDTAANVSTGAPFTITLTRDDQPVTEGTPYNKASVLPDELANILCPGVSDPTPAQAVQQFAIRALTGITIELPSSGWTGEEAPYSQTVAVEGMTSDRTFSAPTSGDNSQGVLAVSEALGLLCGAESAEGAVTVYATEKPEIDLSIILRG